MERKIVQIGPSTLMVSLPAAFVKETHLKKGDQLQVNISQHAITFTQEKVTPKGKEFTLDIKDLNVHQLQRHLEMLYVNNYEKIVLLHAKPQMYSHKHQKLMNAKETIAKLTSRFIGMEIVSQTRNSTELHCFLLDKEKDLHKIEKRIYFLFQETVEEFMQGIDTNHDKYHQQAYYHHDVIVKFITYSLRVLHQSELTEEEKRQLFSLYFTIDKVLDKIRHCSEMVHRHGCSAKAKAILSEIFNLVLEQFQALHSARILDDLIRRRYELVRKVEQGNYTLDEYKVIAEAKIMLDTINDFSRVVIVKNLSQA